MTASCWPTTNLVDGQDPDAKSKGSKEVKDYFPPTNNKLVDGQGPDAKPRGSKDLFFPNNSLFFSVTTIDLPLISPYLSPAERTTLSVR